jgi:hypothetical protein
MIGIGPPGGNGLELLGPEPAGLHPLHERPKRKIDHQIASASSLRRKSPG